LRSAFGKNGKRLSGAPGSLPDSAFWQEFGKNPANIVALGFAEEARIFHAGRLEACQPPDFGLLCLNPPQSAEFEHN
jgi:hypothetical protein